jgi:sugar phosphate isomerase/epimerase
MGQQDPIVWINKYKDRIQLLHIKDFIIIGDSGAMNFEKIFHDFYANGHRNWFVEIEDINSGKQLERAEASAKYLLGKGFVK